MKEDYIIIELPLPISVNICYAWTKRRYKSEEYKNWLDIALYKYKEQTEYNISWDNWLEITLNYFLPLYCKSWKKKKQDLDNFIKPTLDFLWHNLKGFKDEHIKVINAKKTDSKEQIVKIMIKEII